MSQIFSFDLLSLQPYEYQTYVSKSSYFNFKENFAVFFKNIKAQFWSKPKNKLRTIWEQAPNWLATTCTDFRLLNVRTA